METMTLEKAAGLVSDVRSRMSESIFGQTDLINETICCLISGGHILMTGAPGLAKTTLVRVFARHLGLNFGRVQFTPDLLPSDIVGSDILNIDPESGQRSFMFAKGPVFTNMLLADEINRASPRTQSALLEAMQERTVTVGGKQHKLTHPFMVFATQNPFESEGTFPLPEAQMDRFLCHSLVDYPDDDAEQRILKEHSADKLVGERTDTFWDEKPKLLLGGEEVTALIQRARQIQIDDEILTAIKELVRSTRPEDEMCPDSMKPAIWYGAGPRAGISLISMSRAFALLENCERVRWSHVRRMTRPVLRHRIRLTAEAMRDAQNEDSFVGALLERVESRHKNLARGID